MATDGEGEPIRVLAAPLTKGKPVGVGMFLVVLGGTVLIEAEEVEGLTDGRSSPILTGGTGEGPREFRLDTE